MRFAYLIIVVVLTIVLYRNTLHKTSYKYNYNVNHSKSYHDSMMVSVLVNNKLIDSVNFKGKNGYVFFTPKAINNEFYILIKEVGINVNTFRLEEFRNGRWVPIYFGEKIGRSNIVKMKVKKNYMIRLHIVSSLRLPRVIFSVYST